MSISAPPSAAVSAIAFPALRVRPNSPRVVLEKNPTVNGKLFPVRVFELSSIDSEFKAFQDVAIPAFRQLQWDPYDQRRAIMEAIAATNQLTPEEQHLSLAYYRGEIELEFLKHLLSNVEDSKRERLLNSRATRKKAFTQLTAKRQDNGDWVIAKLLTDSVEQRVSASDYRSIGRKYEQIPSFFFEHPKYQELISNLLFLVAQAEPDRRSLQITAWMMSCYSWPKSPSSNTPEGIHQDGADYITSAVVLERTNVVGAESRVFVEDLTTPYMTTTLQPGQGLFHSDTGSPIWHDATLIKVADPDQEFGVRSILAFDIFLQ
jgi:hypothetical protein